MLKRIVLVGILLGAVGVGAGAYYGSRDGQKASVATARVTRGAIVDTVTATGSLQAVTTVQVGTQVSGTISWLGADFNSIVRKGDVIAKLDPSLIQAQVEQSRANMTKVAADVDNARVRVDDAQQKYERAMELKGRQLIPASDLETAKLALDTAAAQLKSANAQLLQAQAALSQTQLSLDHTIITTPIDGIVIQRSVDVGQTVAASLQSPTIFVIAADLSEMQVSASIDESDMGRIRAGQHVTFSVDAYPGEPFSGTLVQVRLQPTVVQNVTTYNAIIDVPNPDLKLKPGMTASVSVEVAKAEDAVRIPNAALRFRPTVEALASLGQVMPASAAGKGEHVWVDVDGLLQPVPVQVGISDGQTTELVDGAIHLDTLLVTNISTAGTPTRAAASATTGGLFMPPTGGGAGGGQRQGARGGD